MRGSRGTLLWLSIACGAGGCQVVAGIEDLHLTTAAPDGSMDDAGDDALPEASGEHDGPGGDSGGDAGVRDAGGDAPSDATADSTRDSPAPVDANEAGITYAQEVLLDQPLAYWRFDETSGTTANDSSGNGNNGSYVGGVTFGAPGAIVNDPGTSVTFDGATSWMSAGDLFAFAGATPCSFEAWVKPVLDAYYHEVLSRSDGQAATTTGYLIYIEPQSVGLMDFAHYMGATTNIAESNTPIATGAFTHLVGVYDGSFIALYANGVLKSEIPTTFPTPATTNPFVVGAQSNGLTGWFLGQIDEVAVYGTALTPARVQAHYNVGMGLGP